MQVNIRGIPAPKLMNLTATAGVGSVSLTWDNPNNPIHKMTEVWTSAYSDGSNAQRLANVNDYAYVVVDASPTPMYYWVRSISIYGRVDGPISDMAIKAGNAVTGTAAQALSIGASSQIFLIQKGGAVAPQTISLFASTQNMQGTPVWSITAGTATLNDPSNANPYQKDLTYTSMTTDTVTVQVAMNGLTDQITLVKVKDGIDSLTSMLSNESATVPADFTGAITGGALANAGGSCIVYNGTNKVLTGATYSIISPTAGLTMGITTAGVYSVTALTVDSGSAIVRAVYNNIVMDKVYNISKAKQGARGSDGYSSNGSDGQRGTVNLQASPYSAWDAAAARTLIVNSTGTQPMLGDIVTLYNATFSTTYYYSGTTGSSYVATNWKPLTAYINGNLLVSGTLSASSITTGTLTGVNINIGGGYFTVQPVSGTVRTTAVDLSGTNLSYDNTTNPTQPAGKFSAYDAARPAVQAIHRNTTSGVALALDGGVSSVTRPQASASANAMFNNVLPNTANAYVCGSYGNPWQYVVTQTSAVTGSDRRYKEDITDSDLGLEFVEALRPVSYRLIEGRQEIIEQEPFVGPMPEGELPPEATPLIVSVPGVRRHYGFIAQEVKEALGERDAAFWIIGDMNDPDSRQQLRYEELISPLVKAVQELSAQVKSLQDQLNAA